MIDMQTQFRLVRQVSEEFSDILRSLETTVNVMTVKDLSKEIRNRKNILKLLQDTCRNTGKNVIVITHNQAITAMADRVIHIKNGTVMKSEINPQPTPVERIEW